MESLNLNRLTWFKTRDDIPAHLSFEHQVRLGVTPASDGRPACVGREALVLPTRSLLQVHSQPAAPFELELLPDLWRLFLLLTTRKRDALEVVERWGKSEKNKVYVGLQIVFSKLPCPVAKAFAAAGGCAKIGLLHLLNHFFSFSVKFHDQLGSCRVVHTLCFQPQLLYPPFPENVLPLFVNITPKMGRQCHEYSC